MYSILYSIKIEFRIEYRIEYISGNHPQNFWGGGLGGNFESRTTARQKN